MSVNSSSSWEKFVQDNLLYANILDGILLLTLFGEQVYSWGPKINDEEFEQFKGVFNSVTEKQDLDICRKGFTLNRDENMKVHYNVYKKSLCSMYCLSENRQNGLMVCNLPYGILVTTYSQPTKDQDAIELVENACTLLRS